MILKLIVAMCKNNGIGNNNKIPWHITEDMQYFSKKTSGNYGTNRSKKNAVIMGRNTWESLPKKYKPLPDRFNIVLTKNIGNYESNNNIIFSSSVDDAIDLYYGEDEKGEKGENAYLSNLNDFWVIGGSSIYQEFIKRDLNINNNKKCISKYYITYIDKDYDCDTYFPLLENMNKYHLTRFEKHKCIDTNTPNHSSINVYYIVFKKIEYTDEKIIQKLFTSYKSKYENKSNLILYVKNTNTTIYKNNCKIFLCDNGNENEILFSMFCS